MAIRDLLWACPACRSYGSIRTVSRREVCVRCHARFRRKGGTITLVFAGGATETKTPLEWEAGLPPLAELPENGCLGPQRAAVRWGRPALPVRARGRLIGWAERFDKPLDAAVDLDPTRLRVVTRGETHIWPLEQITAVQPSSKTLQINAPGRPLVSLRFLEDSVRRWEAALQNTIRARHEALGRGPILQFHPRIRFA